MMKSRKKLVMKKKTKVLLSTILVLVLVVAGGFYLPKSNIVNKLFSGNLEKKTERIKNQEVNNDDLAFNGLKISFVDKSGETASPVDYGILDSTGASKADVYLKITNDFATDAHVTVGNTTSRGLNVTYDVSPTFNLEHGKTIYIKADYSASSVTDGGVYSFVTDFTYTLDKVYDADSSNLKTFSKSITYAASYKNSSSSYAGITIVNKANNDGSTDTDFTMTPKFISANDNFYADTSFNQGSCNVNKTGWVNSKPGKCSSSYTMNLFVNREVYGNFSNVGFSFDVTNNDGENNETLKFNGTPTMNWNDNDEVPTINSGLTSGISSKGGKGTFELVGNIPAHNSNVKTLTLSINFIEDGSSIGKTEAGLTMTANLYAYTTTVYNNLLNLITTQEQSGLIQELAGESFDLSNYYTALENARRAIANPRKTDYEMNNAYNNLNDIYNQMTNELYGSNKIMVVNDLFFTGDMSSGVADSSETHYRVYAVNDSYAIPQNSTYLNETTTNRHSLQYTGTADNNYVFNNKYWHINAPSDTTDVSDAIARAQVILDEDSRKYTSETRQNLADKVAAATSYIAPDAIDQPEYDSDFTDIVTDINTAIDNMEIAKYTIKYVDDDYVDDGEHQAIQEEELEFGKSMPTAPTDPTKESTAQYDYEFSGWASDATEASQTVVENVTYTATYTSTIRSYTITFDDGNGNEISSESVEYGQMPNIPADPAKEADVQYTYTFKEWDPAVTTVLGEQKYTAIYTSVVNKYTITFKDYNGDVLKQSEVEYGTMPTAPENPTRTKTESTIYTFTGWDSEIETVTGAKVYTAQYSESPRPYTITFYDDDKETVLYSDEVSYGETPEYKGETPSKEATAQYTYTFAGWTPTIEAVTGETSYTATYTSNIRSYTIYFLDYEGNKIGDGQTLEYGTMPTVPADPAKPADAQYTYTFAGWSPSVDVVKQDQTYEPTYTQTVNQYEITFYDADGTTVLDQQMLDYGATPVYAGQTPTKSSTVEFDYAFAGWDKEILSVTGDEDYTATYSPTKRKYDITFDPANGTDPIVMQVEYGETPSYGENPKKDADAQYTYEFDKWTPEIEAVTGPKTYTAKYNSTIRSYTIIFNDEDGTELKRETLDYGQMPTAPADPEKEATAEHTYTFAGWDKEIEVVTGDKTYTATYTSETNEYIIKFVNYDDSELQKETLKYGTMPEYKGEEPTKPSTNAEVFTFKGWDDEISTVTGTKTYTATYSSAPRKYTVKFVDEDNNELQSSEYEYGSTPAYTGEVPTKESTKEFDYVFDNWDKEIIPVTEDITYTVKFKAVTREYVITFNNEDGTELQSGKVKYGETPVYSGTTPSKATTAEYTYAFDKWSPEIVAVEGDATYTATFKGTKNSYEIKFLDEDGTELKKETLEYGSTPTAPENPTKEATVQYTYTFDKWSPEIATVTGNAEYTATYKETVRKYTIKFVNYDDTELQSGELEYGDEPKYNGEEPTKPSTNTENYTFAGWDSEISTVTGDKTYKAKFNSTTRKYTVKFLGENGEELQSSEYEYGATPKYNGEIPIKESTDEFEYTFDNWDKELIPVTEDTTYTVKFKAAKRKYRITFNLANGSDSVGVDFEYGTMPSYDGTPAKEADAEYSYEFSGWDPELVEVTGEATYTAQYTKTKRSYTIIFKDEDGTELKRETVEYGENPTLPENPTKESTSEHSYEFERWNPEVSTVTGNAEYTAVYKETARKYTIKFVNYDDTELQSSEYEYGATPKYNGEEPTKPSTDTESYTFAGWDSEISAVTGDKTYKAKFNSTTRKYTIRFVDEDETVLKSEELEYNAEPTAPENPSKEADKEYTYTFDKWSPEISKVTKDQDYTATYKKTKNKYTIKFVDEDGTELKSEELEYGSTPTAPADPEKEADAENTYTFAGWDSQITTVDGDKTYKATYTTVKNKYTVKFVDENDQVLQSEELEYGVTPVYNGPIQTKEADVQYTYSFDGWTPTIATVTKDVTYKVLFKPALRKYKITFKNYDGTILQESDVDYGTTPSYTGDNPTKAKEGDTEYVFAGWDPAVETVTGEKVYTAKYIEKAKTYQVSFEVGEGSEIASVAVEEGQKLTKPTDPTREGYIFMGWYSDEALENEYDFNSPITEAITLYAKWEEEVVEYKIIEGANQEYVVEEAHDLVITSNGNYAKFIGIKIDGEEVSADKYTSKSGSTIVTLKADYLKTLSKGDHTITFMYRDGEVSTKFTANVVEEEKEQETTDNPVTSDGVIAYIITLLLSIFGATSGTLYIRKKLAKNTN